MLKFTDFVILARFKMEYVRLINRGGVRVLFHHYDVMKQRSKNIVYYLNRM